MDAKRGKAKNLRKRPSGLVLVNLQRKVQRLERDLASAIAQIEYMRDDIRNLHGDWL